jgi:hypothetical protein
MSKNGSSELGVGRGGKALCNAQGKSCSKNGRNSRMKRMLESQYRRTETSEKCKY